MAWETRKERPYYYAAARVDGRVVKTYFGRGQAARLAASFDAEARANRAAERAALAALREQLAGPDRALSELETASDQLLEAGLLAAGYHRTNYGPWRRRRERDGTD